MQKAGRESVLHRGDCAMYRAGFALITREEALAALAGPDCGPCEIRRPETGLPTA
ncbi:DUF6233 domain-containing protein [Streptomyces sp. NPDC002225]|uniref:DUF6233 domain-containing protein n=1 Tax=Streptomyces sp. NPDC002225 TaxID=3154413 RepID=UPI00331DCEDC